MKKILFGFLIFLLLLSFSSFTFAKFSLDVGTILIPAYFDPSSPSFTKLLNTNTTKRQIVILNVEDGPGDTPNTDYKNSIRRLILRGKIPIGYVYTSYGKRELSEVKRDIDNFYKFYPNIKGIFLDEVSEDVDFYANLFRYIKETYKGLIILNPGTNFKQTLLSYCDFAVVFEGNTKEFLNFKVDESLLPYKNKLVLLIYGVEENDFNNIIQTILEMGIKNFYITNDDLPNPWDTLSDYMGRF